MFMILRNDKLLPLQKESDMQRQLSALRVELSTERSQRIRFETDAERLGHDIETFRKRNTVLVEELTRSIERVHQAEKQHKVHCKANYHTRSQLHCTIIE
jgi:hypothetical protein